MYVLQGPLPPLFCQGVTQESEVDEIECPEEFIWERFGDVLLKEFYLIAFLFFRSWELCRRNVTGKDLDVAVANASSDAKSRAHTPVPVASSITLET
jgi:hypothetical protein